MGGGGGDLCSEQPHWLSQTQLKLRGLTTLHNEKVRWFSVKETIQLELEYPDATRGRKGGGIEKQESINMYNRVYVTISREQTKRIINRIEIFGAGGRLIASR